jgi:hypothetical protein
VSNKEYGTGSLFLFRLTFLSKYFHEDALCKILIIDPCKSNADLSEIIAIGVILWVSSVP